MKNQKKVEERRKIDAEENLQNIVEELRRCRWSLPKGFAAEAVREDRDIG